MKIKTSEMISNEQRFTVLLTALSNSKCTKLITFHFKLIHRWIATNSFLNKLGIKDSDKCSFCENEPEHLGPVYKVIPGKRVTLPAESTSASVYMRKKLTPFPEPTAVAHVLIVSP